MASKGVNKAIILGNLCDDPTVRFMPNGNAVANITVATNESWKDQQGQLQEKAEFHRVVMYKKLAEIAGEYLKKGSQIYLEGKLQTRKWQNQQGQDQYTTEIVANNMQMLSGGQGNQRRNEQQRPQQNNYQQYNNQRNQNQAPAQQPEPDFDFDDD